MYYIFIDMQASQALQTEGTVSFSFEVQGAIILKLSKHQVFHLSITMSLTLLASQRGQARHAIAALKRRVS